jgi:3-dehydrosphinganine reductase
VAGFVGLYGYTDYCASKFAVIGFSETLRSELKPDNITVSILCPPDTDTPGFKTENLTKPRETIEISGKVKLLSAQEVADQFIKGILKQTKIIIPSMDGKFTIFMKRLLPSIVDGVMDGAIAKVRKSQSPK